MEHVIRIEGFIGLEVTAETVRQQLQLAPAGASILVRINSDGGSVSEGVAIYNELRAANVTTEVIGWALSAASLVLQAGRTRRIYPTSLVMVHAPWVEPGPSNAEALRRRADLLDQVELSMRAAYRSAGISDARLNAWFDGQDHWFTADEALKAGLVDTIVQATQEAAATSRQAFASARIKPPQHLTERLFTVPAPTITPPANSNDQGEAAIRAAAVLAEVTRRQDVRAKFTQNLTGARAADPRLIELQRACEDDPACTPAAAGERLLAAIAADITPVSGHYAPRDFGGIGNGNDSDRAAELVAAASDVLVMRAGLRVADPHPATRDVKSLSVVAMAERLLSLRGQRTAGLSSNDIIKAAMSTSDFPSLLGATVNKSLLAGYDAAPATFRGWTGEREVKDFKPGTLVRLSEAPGLALVAPGAEYTYGKLDDSGSTFQMGTYGRLLKLTRQALVNDDTGAFTELPAAMGAAAVRLEADSVYAKLTSNPTLGDGIALFHASHGNLAGAATLDLAGLGAARAAMRKQKGLQGLEYIDLQPRFLLVPVALETQAEQLIASLVDPAKNNDTANVQWVRNLTLVADPRLDAVSASQWYLAASPMQSAGIVRAYLTGESRPYVDQKEGFEVDALTMKVRLDLATGVSDFRALYRVG